MLQLLLHAPGGLTSKPAGGTDQLLARKVGGALDLALHIESAMTRGLPVYAVHD